MGISSSLPDRRTRGATWAEIDLDARLWIVPAERMKAKKEYRVPLSKRAVALLMQAWADYCAQPATAARA